VSVRADGKSGPIKKIPKRTGPPGRKGQGSLNNRKKNKNQPGQNLKREGQIARQKGIKVFQSNVHSRGGTGGGEKLPLRRGEKTRLSLPKKILDKNGTEDPCDTWSETASEEQRQQNTQKRRDNEGQITAERKKGKAGPVSSYSGRRQRNGTGTWGSGSGRGSIGGGQKKK